MKKRNGKKNEVMAGRAKCESLQLQAEWGAKKLGVEMSDVVRQRITEEVMVLGNMGLVEAVLTLKDAMVYTSPSHHSCHSSISGLCFFVILYALMIEKG